MGVVWCGPLDAELRGEHGQSAPGGMISGSILGVSALGTGCCRIM
jgi:hypothetical protein